MELPHSGNLVERTGYTAHAMRQELPGGDRRAFQTPNLSLIAADCMCCDQVQGVPAAEDEPVNNLRLRLGEFAGAPPAAGEWM